ncbi:hypothetical protein WA026_011534 [Henosepilachna vigintioctopunctata]|uniref:Transcription initiation factor IIF subunit alpha n=1 Tax=Henosepilachna vigintioctopunctata TaxID=420089 RepID=A0AAW1TT46_9CUCU
MATTPANVREYSIRVPKNSKKRFHVMRFNGNLEVDIGKWSQVKMERENNMREYKGIDEDQPKFGAGSEFGREAKEEARRKKLGIIARKYKADDQPWILKCCGSTVKKFKGIREGGVSENTAYYVFTHAEDGAIEAFPLQEWYKFQPIQRYKCLSAEEAEQEFSKRNKHLNFFSLMLRKRLKGEDDTELDEEEKGKKTTKKSKELKISEMDEWMNTSDDDSSDEETKKEEEEEKQDKKKSKKNVPKKKKRDTDVEAFEDSDDGDGEGRELDYISDSSESEPENTNLESVAEEKALRKLLNSDDEEEDSDKSDKEMSNEDEDKEKEGENAPDEKAEKDKKKKPKKKVKKDPKKDVKKEESNSDFSSDSSTDDESKKKPAEKKPKKEEKEISSENSSRSVTPTDSKRKIVNDALAGPSAKKIKLDLNPIPGLSESGITEDAVRKYLMRKPMTTTELLQKFKSKKTGLSSEQLVNVMTQILKKINPVKQILKGKMYLSIKS